MTISILGPSPELLDTSLPQWMHCLLSVHRGPFVQGSEAKAEGVGKAGSYRNALFLPGTEVP